MSQAGVFLTNGGGGGGGTTSFLTDDGIATPLAGVINIITNNFTQQAGSTVLFTGSGNEVVLIVTDINDNTIIGNNSGNAAISGFDNTVLGASSAKFLTSGEFNTIIGSFAATDLTTGIYNVLIGNSAGDNYQSNESNNILIGSLVTGTLAESNVLRVGVATGTGAGELNQAFICGIDGINVGSTANIVTEFGNQLGTAVITGGTGITVTPGANSIVISGSGSITLAYTNVNTSPYIVLITDDYLSVDTSGGPITIQLPNAATLGRTFVIKDRTGTADTDNITVTTVGGVVNIDGSTTFVMDTEYQSIAIIGNGSSYEIY
jgi:hypothetical protein